MWQKKKHHQLRTILCGRCKLLSHGHMVTAVGGHGGYSGGKQFILAEELREKLSDICYDKVLIVKLVHFDFFAIFVSNICFWSSLFLLEKKNDIFCSSINLMCSFFCWDVHLNFGFYIFMNIWVILSFRLFKSILLNLLAIFKLF